MDEQLDEDWKFLQDLQLSDKPISEALSSFKNFKDDIERSESKWLLIAERLDQQVPNYLDVVATVNAIP